MLRDQTVLRREWAILLWLLVAYNAYLWIKRDAPTEDAEVPTLPKLKNFISLFVSIVILSVISSKALADWNPDISFWISFYSKIFLWFLVLLFIFTVIKKNIPCFNKNTNGIWLTILKLIASLWLLVLASHHVVNAAIYIAQVFWLSERAIWATIVAAGTSLPEIAATVAAIIKKNYDMGVGNVIWSDIFNILWIIWISSVIAPLSLESTCLFVSDCNAGFLSMLFRDNIFSVLILFATLIITLIFMRTKWRLSKTEWIFLFLFALLRMVFEINPNFFARIFGG
jgi:Ca2+/Na+ antiporter